MNLENFKEIEDTNGKYYINKDGDVWNNYSEFFIPIKKRKSTEKLMYVLHYNKKSYPRSLDSLMSKYFPELDEKIEDIDGEEWVDIKGYEDEYMVSSFGRVKSLDRYISQAGKPRFIKGRLLSLNRNNGNGYINVQLTRASESKNKNSYIHILVAEHFIDNPNNFETVNHINFNKSKNTVDNLEWCSLSDNIVHYKENCEEHFLNDIELLTEINILHNKDFSVEEISQLKSIEYPRVIQILNSSKYNKMFLQQK